MSNHELQSHKRSDGIKWVIVFALIAVLFAGMIVSFRKERKEVSPADNTQAAESTSFEDDTTDFTLGE